MFWKGLSDRIALTTGNFVKLFGDADIPPLPELTTRLLGMCREDCPDVAELSRLISCDVGLSAKVLSTVNSSCFGLRHTVTSVRHAISLLGMKKIGSLITAFLVTRQLPASATGFHRIRFWQNSVQRSVFAHNLAARISPGEEAEAFTGGLLQDMALPILLDRWSKHYLPTYELAATSERSLHHLEDELLSWNHAQAGAWMARNWALPDVLVCCVGLHNSTVNEIRSLEFEKTPIAAVAISSHLPDARSLCCDEFEFSSEQYDSLCQETDVTCVELASLFGIPRPKPLYEPAPDAEPVTATCA